MVRRDRHPCRSNSAAARAQGSWRIGHSAISAGGVLASGRACREKLLRFALRPSFTQRAVPRVLFWRASEQSRDADASGLERSMVPRRMTRAQGMPGAGRNPWPACSKKSRRQSPQVQPNTGIPRAMVFTVITCSPRCTAV